jgi:hypothetical protein
MISNGLALSYCYNMPIMLIDYKIVTSERPHIKNYEIFNSFNMIDIKDIFDYNNYNEIKQFKYNEIILYNDTNYIINGYYQSYKYFEKYIDRIKSELFNNIPKLIEETTLRYNELKNNKKTILLHVRRGDYYNSDEHYIIDESYYEKSLIDFFTKNNKDDYRVFLFTDGIDEVNTWKIMKEYNIMYIDENNPEIIFLIMIQFDHYIIANSSLSLIAYYFRNNKEATIAVPPKWVVGVNSYDDMIC